VSTL